MVIKWKFNMFVIPHFPGFIDIIVKVGQGKSQEGKAQKF